MDKLETMLMETDSEKRELLIQNLAKQGSEACKELVVQTSTKLVRYTLVVHSRYPKRLLRSRQGH